MKMINFQIVFGKGLMCRGEPMAGELVFYRSARPLPAQKNNHYLAAPGSDEEYLRVPVRNLDGQPVSDVVSLEASARREVQAAFDEDKKPTHVYSCVHLQQGSGVYIFSGVRVPESLSEETTYAALLLANQWPEERRMSIAEAERIRPLAG